MVSTAVICLRTWDVRDILLCSCDYIIVELAGEELYDTFDEDRGL